jgi:hypothetical protein
MNSDLNPPTPFQEAISIISISAILVAVGRYVTALNNAPFLSPCLFWLSVQVYSLFPTLSRLRGAQVPMLVAASAAGILFFIFTIPLAYWLAGVFSRAGIDSIDRQTVLLNRLRESRKKKRRDNDDFSVS